MKMKINMDIPSIDISSEEPDGEIDALNKILYTKEFDDLVAKVFVKGVDIVDIIVDLFRKVGSESSSSSSINAKTVGINCKDTIRSRIRKLSSIVPKTIKSDDAFLANFSEAKYLGKGGTTSLPTDKIYKTLLKKNLIDTKTAHIPLYHQNGSDIKEFSFECRGKRYVFANGRHDKNAKGRGDVYKIEFVTPKATEEWGINKNGTIILDGRMMYLDSKTTKFNL